MRVKNAKKASSELQKMQTTLGRNCCSKTAPKLSAVIHCLQWITAKIALKMQWDFGHSENLQNLQGNCMQCRKGGREDAHRTQEHKKGGGDRGEERGGQKEVREERGGIKDGVVTMGVI